MITIVIPKTGRVLEITREDFQTILEVVLAALEIQLGPLLKALADNVLEAGQSLGGIHDFLLKTFSVETILPKTTTGAKDKHDPRYL